MTSTKTPDQELIDFIIEQGDGLYKDVHQLEDGTIVGTVDLLFTRGLMIDMDRYGYGHRYCYENRKLATKACNQLQSGDDKPLSGYIAERHSRE